MTAGPEPGLLPGGCFSFQDFADDYAADDVAAGPSEGKGGLIRNRLDCRCGFRCIQAFQVFIVAGINTLSGFSVQAALVDGVIMRGDGYGRP